MIGLRCPQIRYSSLHSLPRKSTGIKVDELL